MKRFHLCNNNNNMEKKTRKQTNQLSILLIWKAKVYACKVCIIELRLQNMIVYEIDCTRKYGSSSSMCYNKTQIETHAFSKRFDWIVNVDVAQCASQMYITCIISAKMQEKKKMKKKTHTPEPNWALPICFCRKTEKRSRKKNEKKKLYMYREMGIALHGICAYNWSIMFNKTERTILD